MRPEEYECPSCNAKGLRLVNTYSAPVETIPDCLLVGEFSPVSTPDKGYFYGCGSCLAPLLVSSGSGETVGVITTLEGVAKYLGV